MSRQIFFWLFRRFSTYCTLVALILGAIIWLTQSLRLVKMIVHHQVPLKDYLKLVALLIPDLLSIVLPAAVLISSLFVWYRLRHDHELISLRACGVSNYQIAAPLLSLGVILSLLLLANNIVIVPQSFRCFRDLEHSLRNKLSITFIQPGIFHTFRNMTIYISAWDENNNLKGIFIHNSSSPSKPEQKPYTVIAQSGQIHASNKGLQMHLHDGQRQEPGENGTSILHFKELSHDLTPYLIGNEARSVKPYERELPELLNPPEELDTVATAKLLAEGHQRLLTPWLSLMYAIVSSFFILKARTSKHKRSLPTLLALTTGSLIHIGVIALTQMNHHFSWTIYASYILLIGSICIGFNLLSERYRWAI